MWYRDIKESAQSDDEEPGSPDKTKKQNEKKTEKEAEKKTNEKKTKKETKKERNEKKKDKDLPKDKPEQEKSNETKDKEQEKVEQLDHETIELQNKLLIKPGGKWYDQVINTPYYTAEPLYVKVLISNLPK